MMEFEKGIYKHYKGNMYELLYVLLYPKSDCGSMAYGPSISSVTLYVESGAEELHSILPRVRILNVLHSSPLEYMLSSALNLMNSNVTLSSMAVISSLLMP